MPTKKPAIPEHDVDLVLVYTDDNSALYANGRKVAENEDEKTPLALETVAEALVGHTIKSWTCKERPWSVDDFHETLEETLKQVEER